MDPMSPQLINNSTNISIEINQSPFTVGRGLNCNYVIVDGVISREHCQFEKTENGWCLRDKSTNGTYVNTTLIKGYLSNPLQSFDVIQLSEHCRYTFQNCVSEDISDEQLCTVADTVLDTIDLDSDTSLLNPPPQPPIGTIVLDCCVEKTDSARERVSDIVQPSKRLKTANNSSPSTSRSNNIIDLTDDSFRTELEKRCDPSTSSNVNGNLPAVIPDDNDSVQIISTTSAPTTEMFTIENVCSVAVEPEIKNSQKACTSYKNMGQVESQKPEDDKHMLSESQVENELQCIICAEMFIKASTLNCSHTFCKYCIDKWKEKQTQCPVCRTKITSQVPTLVLDNFIDKIIEGSSKDIQDRRKEMIKERTELQQKPKELPPRQRAQRGNRRVQQVEVDPVVIDDDDDYDSSSSLSSASTFSTEADSDWERNGDYWNDDWYTGAYYGGYGHCFACGRRGHWANGCPFR